MTSKHYSRQELENYFDPKLAEDNLDLENIIRDHLLSCEACSATAAEVKGEMWTEVKSKFKGF